MDSGGDSKTLSSLISYGLPFICKRSCWSYRSLGMVRCDAPGLHDALARAQDVHIVLAVAAKPYSKVPVGPQLTHEWAPVSRKITVSPKGTTWLGYSLRHVSGKSRATIMSAPSEFFMNPSCMAYKPIEDGVDWRQKLKLTGAQNTSAKEPCNRTSTMP